MAEAFYGRAFADLHPCSQRVGAGEVDAMWALSLPEAGVGMALGVAARAGLAKSSALVALRTFLQVVGRRPTVVAVYARAAAPAAA